MQKAASSNLASSTGMTAEVAGAPCKRCRSRFDSDLLHGFCGIEEDGNLPDPDSGETRFDSGDPDVTGVARQVARMLGEREASSSNPSSPTGMWCKGERAWPGTR